MSRRFSSLLVATCALACVTPASAQDVPAPRGFVTDDAGVLGADVRRGLASRLADFERRTRIEVAVVTVRSLGGATVEDCAARLWESWGVGKSATDDGVLLLVAP